jgi:hypothetical protein
MSDRVKRVVRTLVAASLLTAVIGVVPASAAPGDGNSTFAGVDSSGVIFGLQPAKPGVPNNEDC